MRLLLCNLSFLCLINFQGLLHGQDLQVSDNGRYLVYEDGKPFFYLGDTAWELFHRLSIDDAKYYLENRAEKGFTVIQAVVLAQLGGLDVPNANGYLPLQNGDPTQPLENYFKHVDTIVKMANNLGLTIGMLPTWGTYWKSGQNNQIFNPSNAEHFGRYLGNRYRESQIIWILGGDENINSDEEHQIITAMAKGLKMGDGGNHLITFHPRGPGLSSDYFHQSEWLDFNMYQSSHGARNHDNGLFAKNDRALTPIKPTLDGEPRYELIPVGFYFPNADRTNLFSDDDARQAAYLSLFSGACGHTYGHNSIWQMWTPDKKPVIGAVVPWQLALDHPGAIQMKHLRKLIKEYPIHTLTPSDQFILDGPTQGHGKTKAVRHAAWNYALVYSSEGVPFTVRQQLVQGTKLKTSWFDPRYGIFHEIATSNTFAIQTYTPPTTGVGQDWVLILEGVE